MEICTEADLREVEAGVVAAVADVMRRLTLTLPDQSEVRPRLLASATRLALWAQDREEPHPSRRLNPV